jgi:hypothetical protein
VDSNLAVAADPTRLALLAALASGLVVGPETAGGKKAKKAKRPIVAVVGTITAVDIDGSGGAVEFVVDARLLFVDSRVQTGFSREVSVRAPFGSAAAIRSALDRALREDAASGLIAGAVPADRVALVLL